MLLPSRASLRRRVAAVLPPLARRDQLLAKRARIIAKLQTQRADLRAALEEASERRTALQSELQMAVQARDDLSAEVAELTRRAEITERLLRADPGVSFRTMLAQHAALAAHLRKDHQPQHHALAQIPYKLRNIALAQSHGVATPQVYEVWSDASSIRLGELPDQFVLKADGGASSQAVFPLERTGTDQYSVIDGRRHYTENELRARITTLGRRARAPYFAEELLEPTEGGVLPDDIKLYAFYGQVELILVQRIAVHGRRQDAPFAYFAATGENLGDVQLGKSSDLTLEPPALLKELVRTASHLSRAVGLPFCRVDLYQTTKGVHLGEVTQIPTGGKVRFVPNVDAALGRSWLRALVALDRDLNAGRPPGALHGSHHSPSLYPASSRADAPANWPRTAVDCREWCFLAG